MVETGEVRKLMMLISDLRSKDNERYEEHVKFMNEVVTFIKKISDNMNENWKKINTSLQKLNNTIESSLDTLLTGINPEGIKETSASLKEIMETMGKSMQSMNLENLMRELRVMTGRGDVPMGSIPASAQGAEAISAQFGSPYAQGVENIAQPTNEPEIYGFVPDHMKKGSKKKKKKEQGLIKPSDLFK
ncbi:MAG: hypothetical protein GY870_07725 [archaeon]|nr:hypothetical protein [archaeon]